MPGAVHSPDRPERDLHAELLLRSLSERERQVLDLLARGYSNRRIAEACYLSLNTVRTHVQNVLVKLGVHSKLEAAALAVRQGLVQHRGPPGLGATPPEPGGRRRPWVPVGSIVATSSRPAPGPWSAAVLAWRFWPWRRSAGPTTPAGPAPEPVPPPAGLAAVDRLPTDRTRTWLGPPYWANRLQDWRLHQGRLECVAATGPMRTRTVAVLTRELAAGDQPGRIGVRTGTLAAGEGFSGFLIGAGGGRLDHRAAALVQGASGEGGGILCTYEADGSVGFRDHTDEGRQFAYAPLPGTVRSGQPRPRALDEEVELVLELTPRGRGRYRLRLQASDRDGRPLAAARLDGVDGAALTGGIALVSSSTDPSGGARHWFAGLGTAGAKRGQPARAGRGPGPRHPLHPQRPRAEADRPAPAGRRRRPGRGPAPAAPPRQRRLGGRGGGPGRARVRGRLPGDRLGRRRRARLPGPVGRRDRRGAGLRGHGGRRPGRRRTSCGSGCSTAPSTATGP